MAEQAGSVKDRQYQDALAVVVIHNSVVLKDDLLGRDLDLNAFRVDAQPTSFGDKALGAPLVRKRKLDRLIPQQAIDRIMRLIQGQICGFPDQLRQTDLLETRRPTF
jgi:hypothetical protein